MTKTITSKFEEEVLQISRPTTKEGSPTPQIFHLQEGPRTLLQDNESKFRRNRKQSSQDLLRVETHPSQLKNQSLNDSFGELRAHINTHPGREIREREKRDLGLEFSGYQFPDDLPQGSIFKNGLPATPNFLLNGSVFIPNGAYLSSSETGVEGHSSRTNGFDIDFEDDIAIMAAQREQERGSSRYIRGMMAPVISKDDDNRKVMTTRRPSRISQRSESVSHINPEEGLRGSSILGSRRSLQEDMLDDVALKAFRGSIDNKGLPKRLPSDNPFEDFGSRDIMAQSIMRQTLRSSKQNLFDTNLTNSEPFNRFKLGTKCSGDFTVFNPNNQKYSHDRRGSEERSIGLSEEVPTKHDDVQILNLQGFMDGDPRGKTAVPTRDQKEKLRRRHRNSEDFPVDLSRRGGNRSRHRKKSKHSKNSVGKKEDVILKDIDDIDEKMASLVLGPKQTFKEAVGRAITYEEAARLRQILTGSLNVKLPKEWMSQSFTQNNNANLSYGIIQKKGGPCGVLASVQGHILKCLIFGSHFSPHTSPASPLRPSSREWTWALSMSITEILWRIGNNQKAILALPGALSTQLDIGIGRYSPDGLTELLTLHEFTTEESLLSAVEVHLKVFTSSTSSGCVLLLYSALFTRGLENIPIDMDNGGGFLINAHGYASQEVVNLLLTGEATTNTFNGDHTFGDERQNNSKSHSPEDVPGGSDETRRRSSVTMDKMVLRGVHKRSEIGLLSLFEHYGSCKVGSHLKSPEYPVWVVCSESHYTVIFARDQQIARDDTPLEPFDVYYYDGLSLQDDEIRLTIDPQHEPSKSELIPPLELCLRTKWPRVHISWNGTDPILTTMDNADLYAHSNALQRRDTLLVLQQFLPQFNWDNQNGENILDIGCGTGDVTKSILLPHIPCPIQRIVGVDVSQEMVNFASKYFNHNLIEYRQMDITHPINAKQMFPDGFNKITSFYCLHWIQDHETCLRNMYDLLLDDGQVLLAFLASNPIFTMYENMSQKTRWKTYMRDVSNYIPSYQYKKKPSEDFHCLAEEIGFDVIFCRASEMSFPFENANYLKKAISAVNPFASRIPENEREAFLNECLQELMTIAPPNANGGTVAKYSLMVALLNKQL